MHTAFTIVRLQLYIVEISQGKPEIIWRMFYSKCELSCIYCRYFFVFWFNFDNFTLEPKLCVYIINLAFSLLKKQSFLYQNSKYPVYM